MRLVLALLTLAALAWVSARLAARGSCRHTGCTCRREEPESSRT